MMYQSTSETQSKLAVWKVQVSVISETASCMDQKRHEKTVVP